MRRLALVLTCLACVGHGRRAQRSIARQHSSLSAESRRPLTAVDASPSSQSLTSRSTGQVSARGRRHPLRQFSTLILALNPAAFGPSKAQPEPTAPSIDPMLILGIVQTCTHVSKLNSFPTLTSAFIALNLLTVLPQLSPDYAFNVYDYGLQPQQAWQRRGLSWQMVTSSFLHDSFDHLLRSMQSLLLRGSSLEVMMKPGAFLKLMAYAAIVPNAVFVLLSKFWARISRDPADKAAYSKAKYVGLSSAISCLDMVWNLQVLAPQGMDVDVLGISVPSFYAPWVELLMQQLMNPGTSVMRQAAGALAGLGYVYVPRFRRKLLNKLKAARVDQIEKLLLVFAFGLILSRHIEQMISQPVGRRK